MTEPTAIESEGVIRALAELPPEALPDRSERRQRVLAAVRDFYRGNVQTQPGTVKGHSARPAPELF